MSYISSASRTLSIEAKAIEDLIEQLDDSFNTGCQLILESKGRVVVTGMGKSGHIGNKIAATLASTGTPAFFMHPGEASHGDLGMITPQDVVIAISNSGTTAEVVKLVPLLKRMQVPLISMTGEPKSPLALEADAHLNIAVEQEACPLGLAPTSSTTATLAMGDALAVALLEARGFTAEQFAFSHPGGALGKRLLLRVKDVMAAGEAVPTVTKQCTIRKALFEITRKGLGMTTVIDSEQKLLGVYTDGDLRRSLDQDLDIHTEQVAKAMSKAVSTCAEDDLAAEALGIMESKNITALPVINDQQQVIGVVHLHDLIKAGLA